MGRLALKVAKTDKIEIIYEPTGEVIYVSARRLTKSTWTQVLIECGPGFKINNIKGERLKETE